VPVFGCIVQRAKRRPQQPSPTGSEPGYWIVSLGRKKWLTEVEFEQGLRPSAGKGSHAVNRRPSLGLDRKRCRWALQEMKVAVEFRRTIH
jgi:hypothetical protein